MCFFLGWCRVRFDNKCQNNVCFSFVFIKMEMTHKYMNLARMVDLQVELCCVYHCRTANNMELTFHRQRHVQCNLFGNTQKSQKLCTFVGRAMTSFTSFFFPLASFFYLVKYLNRIRVKEKLWRNGSDLFVHFSFFPFFSAFYSFEYRSIIYEAILIWNDRIISYLCHIMFHNSLSSMTLIMHE